MRRIMKLQVLCFITIVSMAFVSLNIPMIKAAEKEPDLWVKIHRIQLIDPIEGFGEGKADWHYYLTIYNGEEWSYHDEGYNEEDDIIINDTYTFKIKSRNIRIYLHLLDTDYWTAPDLADISSHTGGGENNYDEITIGTQYRGTYDLKTNTLTGDSVVSESGYYLTSGELDGSEDVDENDAALWFDIWDNYDPPTADAGPDQTSFFGEKVDFDGSDSTASEGSSIVTYEWDFDDDGITDATGEKTSFIFEDRGKYLVTLTVTDSLGETQEDTCIVKVRGREPSASFTYSPDEPTIRDAVHFNDTSEDLDGTVVSWSWDFGDGTTSTNQAPSHQYSDKGYYAVTLIVTDNDDKSNSTAKVIIVKNLAPSADFTYSPSSPKVGKDIQFTDKSTDPEGKALEYLWDFGDGYTSTQRNPAHEFTSPGSKYVELTVKDDEGAEDSLTKSIILIPNVPPSADFSHSPEDQKMNHDVKFNDESTDSDGDVVEWLWDFGDGATSTQEKPSHQFSEGGEYSVKLTVMDDNGDSDEIIKKVNIIQTYDLLLEVKDSLGLKIANAYVELFTDGAGIASGSTDKQGKLELPDIPEGSYEIRTKVLGVKNSKTCSLTQSKTEEIRVAFSFNIIGIMGGVIAAAAVLGFYLIRSGKFPKLKA